MNQIICGKSEEVLETLPTGRISCSISSPPYWGLRDYGVDGQLGLEKTFEEYIDKLCGIYDQVKRVLRPDGICFVNLGDTYWGSGQGYGDVKTSNKNHKGSRERTKPQWRKNGLQDKSLCLIPQRFAIEMVNRGWILRNVIIWHKPNPMPSSAKDRFTVDFEYVYFFVKNKKYWFEMQYEPIVCPANGRPFGAKGNKDRQDVGNKYETDNPLGKNKRTVWELTKGQWLEWCDQLWENNQNANIWTIPTQGCPEAHFATFPEKLVEPMIKAGCPEFICKKCGKARVKIYKPSEEYAKRLGKSWHDHKDDDSRGQRYTRDIASDPCTADYRFKGYTDCGCNAGWRPGIVLDPFAGAATTLYVAAQHRRDYIGIELKQEYVDKIAIPRLIAVESGVPVVEQLAGQGSLF